MKAYIFPGQGSQFPGMGKDIYESSEEAKALFDQANEILGFNITDIMFAGTDEELKQTKVTQPAIFLHSVILAKITPEFAPDVVAGHSLGEFSALVANGTLGFEDGLKLVYQRALAMQSSCDETQGTMAAIMTSDIDLVEKICNDISEVVVPANYNTPSQLVISGSMKGIELASAQLEEAGAKVIPLTVGGAFHSPLMESARKNLQEAIEATNFKTPQCPIYQNVNAQPMNDIFSIRKNLIDQLTGSVKWSQSIQNMMTNGVDHFIEVGGRGRILLGMVRKIDRKANMEML